VVGNSATTTVLLYDRIAQAKVSIITVGVTSPNADPLIVSSVTLFGRLMTATLSIAGCANADAANSTKAGNNQRGAE
jgi:hypothetical protein